MADIEERAERYADSLAQERPYRVGPQGIRLIRIEAYLAGAAQAQKDYVAHYEGGAS